jgi:LysM repeat protein
VVARWIAPAAFLLAVTGVVLLVRSSLRSDAAAITRTTTTPAPRAKTDELPRASRARTPAQYYVIRSGDTLEAIATRYGTDVDTLLRLNPGVEPTTLRPGQRIRIKYLLCRP